MSTTVNADDYIFYEQIVDKLKRDQSWDLIKNAYPDRFSSRQAVQQAFKRIAQRLDLPYKVSEIFPQEEKAEVQEIPIVADQPQAEAERDFRRDRYGTFEPTHYISDLSDDDWIDTYVDYVFRDRVNDRKITRRDPEYADWQRKWRLQYLTEMSEIIDTHEKVLVLLPRRYGKTERMIAKFARYLLEEQDSLYIVVPSKGHGKKIMRKILRIMRNPRIREDYGDVGSKPVYDNDIFYMEFHSSIQWLELDFPLSIVTWDSAKEGGGARWMHYEDVWQVEFKNSDSNDDIEYRYDNTFDKMLPMRVTATGTRYAYPDDFYTMLRDKYNFELVYYQALTEDYQWLECPNYTYEKLVEMRDTSPASFSTKMNNDPVTPSGDYFKNEHWKEVELPDQHYNTWIVVDPAFDQSLGASKSAILLLTVYKNQLVVKDAIVDRLDTDQKQFEITRLHRENNPLITFIEDSYRQISTRYRSSDELLQLKGVLLFDQKKIEKNARIEALLPPFRRGDIAFSKSCRYLADIKVEYLSFRPDKKTGHWDSLDALATAYEKLYHYIKQNSSTRSAKKYSHGLTVKTTDGWRAP